MSRRCWAVLLVATISASVTVAGQSNEDARRSLVNALCSEESSRVGAAIQKCLEAPDQTRALLIPAARTSGRRERACISVPLHVVALRQEAVDLLLGELAAEDSHPDTICLYLQRVLEPATRIAAAQQDDLRKAADLLAVSPDWRHRRGAVELLAEHGRDEGALKRYRRLLADHEWPVRALALQMLDREAFAVMRGDVIDAVMQGSNRPEQIIVVGVAARSGDVHRLARAVFHEDTPVALNAIEEIGYLFPVLDADHPGRRKFLLALESAEALTRQEEVKEAARSVLGEIRRKR